MSFRRNELPYQQLSHPAALGTRQDDKPPNERKATKGESSESKFSETRMNVCSAARDTRPLGYQGRYPDEIEDQPH
jgi:hypothetical protein